MSLMTPHEKAALMALIEKIPTTTACPDCKHFDFGVCQKWGESVPATVLQDGCPEWVFNPESPPF